MSPTALRVFTVRRARKYKEALEDSANMSNHQMMQTSDEINGNIGRLQLRRLRSKHKQQHLAKKKQSIVKAGHGQSTSSESSSSSSMSDSTKGDATLLFASASLSQDTRSFKPRTGNTTAHQSNRNMGSLHNRCFTNDTIMRSHFKCLILHNR